MPVIECLCGFALNQVSLDGVDNVGRFLLDRFQDQGQRLNRALLRSSRRAWDALEVALAGDTFWNRFDRVEDKSLRQQIRVFLDNTPLPQLDGKEPYRQKCVQELRAARNKGLLLGNIIPDELAARVGTFARYSDPQALLHEQRKVLHQMAQEIYEAGFKTLGWLLGQQAHPGQSVVVVSVKYFFRREVEKDPQLSRGLQLQAMEGLSETVQSSFQQLELALTAQGERIEQLLAEMTQIATQTLEEVTGLRSDAREQHAAVLSEMQGLRQQVQQALELLQMNNQPVTAKHSLSIRNDKESQLVREVLTRYRDLPEDRRRQAPELLNDVGKLQLASGDFDAAQQSFTQAATLAPNDRARAEAHHNAYRAAIERNALTVALKELRQAVELDAARFAPFSFEEYEPQRILGAGGFGVTFLCRLKLSGGLVALKALSAEDLDRDVNTVMQEAAALDTLNHANIIRLRHCGYADSSRRRPYLVMEYFDGKTLEDHVRERGTLPLEVALPLALQIAQGLQAAHSQKILHRDVKPANVLVRQQGAQWNVKLIDFGLAMKQSIVGEARSTQRQARTVIGTSIAGTLDYAAPEQMGKLPGVAVGPRADLFGFAKTMCFALFETTEPTFQDWQKVPTALAELLGRCLARLPEQRPANMSEVLKLLENVQSAPAKKSTPQDLPMAELVMEAPPVSTVTPDMFSVPGEKKRSRTSSSFAVSVETRAKSPREELAFPTTTVKRLLDCALAFCLGMFGAHKFAQGNVGAGLTRVFITMTFCGLPMMAIVGLTESLIYLVKSNEEYDELYRIQKRSWF